MIARALILLATGWQKGPSAVLPVSAVMLGLCDYRLVALWRRKR